MKNYIFALLLLCPPLFAFATFKTKDGADLNWHQTLYEKGAITWGIVGEAPPILRESIIYATSTWCQATGESVVFLESSDPDVKVRWEDEVRWEDGGNSFLALAFIVGSDANITQAVISINSAYNWHRDPSRDYYGPDNAVNLDAVVLHEFGHVLGLGHSIPDDPFDPPTMLPALSAGASTLSQDDIDGILSIYPSSKPASSPVISVLPLKKKLSFLRARRPLIFSIDSRHMAKWDFGDGTGSVSYWYNLKNSIEHKFKKPGKYTVRATLKNGVIVERVVNVYRSKRASKRIAILKTP